LDTIANEIMSTTASPFPALSGQYPPFAVVTDTDHTAWIVIAAALSLSFMMLFGAINIFIRWNIRLRVGLDEGFLAASTVRPNIPDLACSLYLSSYVRFHD
jgi:hypothetical protein